MQNWVAEYMDCVNNMSPIAKEIMTEFYDITGRPIYDRSGSVEFAIWMRTRNVSENHAEEYKKIFQEIFPKDLSPEKSWNLITEGYNFACNEIKEYFAKTT